MLALAELALLCFGLCPRPIRPDCTFVNGLSLGMVFGLVVGFLEGRRITEALPPDKPRLGVRPQA